MSYISTLLAFAIWGFLLKSYSAVFVTPFTLLISVVGIMTSSLILNETLNSTELTGAILIMLGLVFCVTGNKLVNFMENWVTAKK